MSSGRFEDMSSGRFEGMSLRRLEDVFRATIFRLPRRLQDVLKTSSRRLCKTSSSDRVLCYTLNLCFLYHLASGINSNTTEVQTNIISKNDYNNTIITSVALLQLPY